MTIQLNFQGWIGKKENSSIIEGRVCGYGAAQTDGTFCTRIEWYPVRTRAPVD